jgi:hypothetical protein
MNEHRHEVLLRYCADAEIALVTSMNRCARQRGFIARMRSEGHDTASAEQLLRTLLDSRALHRGHLHRLRAELGKVGRLVTSFG